MFRKVLKVIIIICCVIGFIIWQFNENSSEDSSITYELEDIPNVEQIDETFLQTAKYYDSIEESLINNKMTDYEVIELREIVKVIEKEDRCDVFFINVEEGYDYIYTFQLAIKREDKKISYSEPLWATQIGWESHKQMTRDLGKESKLSELEQIVITDLLWYNSKGNFNISESGGCVRWGAYDKSEIKNLTINGEPPTEVMEITLNGEKAYFWYYENLELSRSEVEAAEIAY